MIWMKEFYLIIYNHHCEFYLCSDLIKLVYVTSFLFFGLLNVEYWLQSKVLNSSLESDKSTSSSSAAGPLVGTVSGSTGQSLMNILDANRDTLDPIALGGLGLGFRAAIPKMPSFRVINFFILLFVNNIRN